MARLLLSSLMVTPLQGLSGMGFVTGTLEFLAPGLTDNAILFCLNFS